MHGNEKAFPRSIKQLKYSLPKTFKLKATNNYHESRILGQECTSSIPLGTRSMIASETEEALSYLQSSISTPIIHRDIKSTKILLDDNFTPKVYNFRAWRFVPLDQTQLTTFVQGIFGS